MSIEKDEKIKFTIVLSIYNVELYLDRCIKSIVNQSYKNLEIILVDDGSSDRSYEICNKWKEADARIKVVHKTNEGAGLARNTGLALATGEYIAFFDSDDYVDLTLLKDMANIIKDNEVDLIEIGHYRVNHLGKVINEYIPKLDKSIYIGQEVYTEFWPELICNNPRTGKSSNLLMSPWCGIYKKDCLDSAGFQFVSERDIICEDVYSLMELMPNIKSVQVVSRAYYYYCENRASITNVYKKDRFEKLVYFQKQLIKLCSKEEYNDEIRYRINRPFLDYILGCIKIEVNNMKENGLKSTIKYINKICNNYITKDILNKIPNVGYSKSRKIINVFMKYKFSLGIIFLVIIQKKRLK